MAKSLGVTFAIGAAVSPSVASAFATVEQKMRASQAKMLALSDKARVLAAADAARQRVVETQKVFAAGGGKDPLLREALARELAAFNQAAAAARKYGVAIADISRAHAQTNRALEATQTRLEALQKAQQLKAKRQEAASAVRAAAAPAMAIAMPIKDAIKFESAMASAAKTIDGMRDDSGKLTAKYYEMEAAIKQMGQTLPLTHDQLAKLFAAGGQQGMTAVKDLREFTTMAAQMAVAFDMSNEEAADSIGGFRSALNMTMPEARSLLDLMNHYANTTSASEKGIADVVRRIGSLGTVGGVAAKPMTALAATLVAMKVEPDVAATGIKNLVLAMTTGTAATKGQKKAYASLGIDVVKLAKQMQVDGPAAIISVLEAVQKLPKAQQLSIMQQIFGKESLGSIAPLLANLDKVKENLITCGNESKYAGAMQKEFDNVSGTTANKLILFKNRIQETGITIAGALLPAIQSITETIGPPISAVAKFAGAHKGLTTAAIGLAASLVVLKISVAAVTWIAAGGAGAFNLFKAAIAGFAAASRVATGAQVAFNAVMAANPVGIVVTAIAALGGGLVYLYKTCEPVRTAFDAVFTFIGGKISWVTDKFAFLTNGFKAAAGGVKTAFKGALNFLGFGGDDKEGKQPEEAGSVTTRAVTQAALPKQTPQIPDFEQLHSSFGAPAPLIPAQPATAAAQVLPGIMPPAPQTAGAMPPKQPVLPVQAITSEKAAQSVATKAPGKAAEPSTAAVGHERQAANPVKPGEAKTMPGTPTSEQTAETAPLPDVGALLKQMAAAQGESPKAPPQQPQIVQPQVQVSVNITQNGIPEQSFASGVMNAIKARQAELEQIISSIVNEQARLAYG